MKFSKSRKLIIAFFVFCIVSFVFANSYLIDFEMPKWEDFLPRKRPNKQLKSKIPLYKKYVA